MSTDLAATIAGPPLRATDSTVEPCAKCGKRRRIDIGTDGNGRLLVTPHPCRHCNGEVRRMAERMDGSPSTATEAEAAPKPGRRTHPDKRRTIERGAELFAERESLTGAEVYEILTAEAAAAGKSVPCTKSTWCSIWSAEARKLAGVDSKAARVAAMARGRAAKDGSGQGPGREDAVTPSAGTPPAGTACPGRTISEPVSDESADKSDTGQELHDAAAALLAYYEEVTLGKRCSWLAWIGSGTLGALHCLRLRRALGMELPAELVELREALS